MIHKDVVLVALDEYNYLGVGYLSAVLRKKGYRTAIIDPERGKVKILKYLRKADPFLVGFSVISYGHISDFTGLVGYLRNNNIQCHFTAGGHYSSLNPREILEQIPGIDSVVRFDGEESVCELADAISNARSYEGIRGMVFRRGNEIVFNETRPPVEDLDILPFPHRTILRRFYFDSTAATILAGRGCLNNCSFCNTRAYYREAGGPLKRIRRPREVVREIKSLYRSRKCRLYLFADDDFPIFPSGNKQWVMEFCDGLRSEGIDNKIFWKICCRADEVDENLFGMMRENGLYYVFLGIEDGTEDGLLRLNKQVTPSRILECINTLKKLEIGIDYGFLLFQPSTTFESLVSNLEFLKLLCGDGYMPVTFLKIIPFYKTRVESELKKEGRLIRGTSPDYHFLDQSMDDYYSFIQSVFGEWLKDPGGFVNLGGLLRNHCFVYLRRYGSDVTWSKINARAMEILKEGNLYILQMMTEFQAIFRAGLDNEIGLGKLSRNIQMKHHYLVNRLTIYYDQLYYADLRQKLVLDANSQHVKAQLSKNLPTLFR